MSHCKTIAALMGESTIAVLWQRNHTRLATMRAGVRLEVRVGSGKSTYCRERANHRYLVNYGLGMVRDKLEPIQAARWLSAREIRGRNYYGGDASLLNLLAHTCCHEFAHLVQLVRGERLRGSVHNRAFYRQLDELHQNGLAQELREDLNHRLTRATIDLGKLSQNRPKTVVANNLSPGSSVAFLYHGSEVRGIVKRVNRKSVTVVPEKRRRGEYYRVSPAILQVIES